MISLESWKLNLKENSEEGNLLVLFCVWQVLEKQEAAPI